MVNLSKIGWQNGTLVSKAKVEINGTIYEVEPEEYSGSTPLSAENLRQMETNTENAINEVQGNLDETNQTIENATTYSTEERIVGTYRDGKNIYEKTIVVGALPNDNTSRIDHEIDNFGRLIKIEASWYDFNDDRWYFDKRPPSSTIGTYIDFRVSSTQLIIEGRGTNWASRTRDCEVTIRYTKTTN